jgi:UDP-hydrolysing UDP-N-acetyl-D-glucosamine 2-epimerase
MLSRRICAITGSRADFGLLYWPMKLIQADSAFELQTIVTGMHLSPEFGLTYKAVEEAGFPIHAKVEMLLSSDTAVGVAKSIGLGVIGFADAFERLQPDILLLLGDRFEIFAAAQAALVAGIPVAHIAGGDTTEGAFDEAIRHSVTKMAHIHFVTNEIAARRVRQLGENPSFIFNVGSPGIDGIRRTRLIDRAELSRVLDFRFQKRNLLVTFHPVTLDLHPTKGQFLALLDALHKLGNEIGIILTKPNADNEGRMLIGMIEDFVLGHPNARAYTSLGQLYYLSAVAQVDAVVGNSSSGLYEVPSFGKPTVNIGTRQKGRLRASSVIDCEPKCENILQAIQEAFLKDCSNTSNPYGDGNSSERIVEHLKELPEPRQLVTKPFFDLN